MAVTCLNFRAVSNGWGAIRVVGQNQLPNTVLFALATVAVPIPVIYNTKLI